MIESSVEILLAQGNRSLLQPAFWQIAPTLSNLLYHRCDNSVIFAPPPQDALPAPLPDDIHPREAGISYRHFRRTDGKGCGTAADFLVLSQAGNRPLFRASISPTWYCREAESALTRRKMREIRTEVTLAAPAERIWALLTDCSLYPQWNPLFQKGTGVLNIRERLELTVHLPGITPFTITPQLLIVEPPEKFGWRHTWASTALLTWDYAIELDPLGPDRLRFVQTSTFKGLAGPLFNLALGRSVSEGMLGLNGAVKRWGEKGNVRCLKR